MPLYLDVHHKIDGLNADSIAQAHRKDLEVQKKHGVSYLRYREAAAAVHREAHGSVADEIIEVREGS
jgi:hypothetical protein